MTRPVLLGLACGRAEGNSELLLIAALKAAEASGVETRLVRLEDIVLPQQAMDGSRAQFADSPAIDDRPFVIEQLMACDALIISAPVYSRAPPGQLKMLADKGFGPNADVAFKEETVRLKAEGHPMFANAQVDERVFKPRVGAFISVGGALTPEWTTFGLPLLHLMTFSLGVAIVDQVALRNKGLSGEVLLDDAVMERAARLGRNVAEQIGRPFDEAEWRGDEAGACPVCHCDLIVLRGRTPECATCGVPGRFEVVEGAVTVVFPRENWDRSLLKMPAKREHFHEIRDQNARGPAVAPEVAAKRAAMPTFDRRVLPPSKTGTPVNTALTESGRR